MHRRAIKNECFLCAHTQNNKGVFMHKKENLLRKYLKIRQLNSD